MTWKKKMEKSNKGIIHWIVKINKLEFEKIESRHWWPEILFYFEKTITDHLHHKRFEFHCYEIWRERENHLTTIKNLIVYLRRKSKKLEYPINRSDWKSISIKIMSKIPFSFNNLLNRNKNLIEITINIITQKKSESIITKIEP